MSEAAGWLTIRRGNAPLLISLPHTGTDIPEDFRPGLRSLWLARRDCDWWIDRLYDFAESLDATIVHTAISRTVIDVNRDPSGVSLYPGMATTELCPTTTFDGEALYEAGREPDAEAIARRRRIFFDPYHSAIRGELDRLRQKYATVVLYDCHSIRSVIPRLFEGTLPNFNIGTNDGRSADPDLVSRIEKICDATSFSRVSNGRFKGGYITRSFGKPEAGIHTVQMELACRGYMREPEGPISEANWPSAYDPEIAVPMRAALVDILETCLDFATTRTCP